MVQLTADIVRPSELTSSERETWRSFVRARPELQSPFFQLEFTDAAAEVVPGSQVAVLHAGGEVKGFFPFQRRGSTVYPLGAPLNDYHSTVASPDVSIDPHALMRLLAAPSMAATGWVGARPAADFKMSNALVADLSSGWDAYDQRQRQQWRRFFGDKDRARRSLARDLGPVSTIIDPVHDQKNLDRLVDLKRRQYARSGRHDIFACGWTTDLLRILAYRSTPEFGATLVLLTAGDEVAALEFSLYSGSHHHFWFPAYEAAAARYSPGILLSLDTMKHFSGEGRTQFDFGLEGEPYKKYFCDKQTTVAEFSLHSTKLKQSLQGVVTRSRFGQSVMRRWSVIDGCETTVRGRLAGVGAAAFAMIPR